MSARERVAWWSLERWMRGGDSAPSKVKRINNPGEAMLKVFFAACALLVLLGLAALAVHLLTYEPEFKPLNMEETGD
ncbi:MAG TPA: hypothetical protein PKM88_02800 [bacterium]|nr:hypothetical protein [bacterium]